MVIIHLNQHKDMDKEKAKELYESIASELMLNFTSYYKFSFSFKGEVRGIEVYVTYGGNSDDVYRYDVSDKPFRAPETFEELMRDYYFVVVNNGEDKFESCHYTEGNNFNSPEYQYQAGFMEASAQWRKVLTNVFNEEEI